MQLVTVHDDCMVVDQKSRRPEDLPITVEKKYGEAKHKNQENIGKEAPE